MTDIIGNNGFHMVEEDSYNGNAPGGDPSQRRQDQQHQPHQPQGPQIRRIFRGQPPSGFRFSRRHVHPNDVAGIDPNIETVGPSGNINSDFLRDAPSNGDMNENSNANSNRNVQRLRLNMGGRGSFVVRHHHPMGPNGAARMGPTSPIPVQVRMVQVQVDPLAPQPLSASTATHTSAYATTNFRKNSARADQRVEDPPVYERFKCDICYEYL